MPSEVPFPNQEKYEVEKGRANENFVNYEGWVSGKTLAISRRCTFSMEERVNYQEVGIDKMASDYQEISKPNWIIPATIRKLGWQATLSATRILASDRVANFKIRLCTRILKSSLQGGRASFFFFFFLSS